VLASLPDEQYQARPGSRIAGLISQAARRCSWSARNAASWKLRLVGERDAPDYGSEPAITFWRSGGDSGPRPGWLGAADHGRALARRDNWRRESLRPRLE
jgi:hypothetical protein